MSGSDGIIFRWRHFGYGLDPTGFSLYPNGSSVGTGISTTPLGDGAWHYVVATYDGSNIDFYVDGALAASTSASGSPYYEGPQVAIGRDADACDGVVPSFEGNIAQVAVYNYALSAAQVAAHYAAATVPVPPPTPDQPLTGSALAPSGAIFNPRTGVALVQEAWEFTDADPGALPTDFSASIDWGDGTTSAVGVSQTCLGQSCFFVVVGSHAYLSTGTFTATAHVRDNRGRNDGGGSTLAIPVTIVVTQLLSVQNKQALEYWANLVRSNANTETMFSLASVLGFFAGPEVGKITSVVGGVLSADSYTKGQQADQLSALAADPPDPNFRAIVSPVLAKRIAVARAVPAKLRRLLQAWLDNGRQETALFKALLVSLERAQGAAAAGDGEWTLRQQTAAAGFASSAATALRDEATLLSRLRTALAHTPRWNPVLSARQARRAQRLVKRQGFPLALKRVLRADGATTADLASLRAVVIATPAQRLAGRAFSQLTNPSRLAKLVNLANELGDYAAQIAKPPSA